MFTWLSILTVNFCIFSYISILFLLITLNSHIFYQNKFQIQNLYESIFIMVKFILVIIYYFIFNYTKTAELILTQHSILNSDQLFDLKYCYQRASADNIIRKFDPRSGPTKSLKLIKPDGFPDFFYHTFESTCKNKGADGTARALRVVPVFNKVGVLAALNII